MAGLPRDSVTNETEAAATASAPAHSQLKAPMTREPAISTSTSATSPCNTVSP